MVSYGFANPITGTCEESGCSEKALVECWAQIGCNKYGCGKKICGQHICFDCVAQPKRGMGRPSTVCKMCHPEVKNASWLGLRIFGGMCLIIILVFTVVFFATRAAIK